MTTLSHPASPIHPDSIDWELYFAALDSADGCPDAEPESDAEWLEVQATYFESQHTDRGHVAAKALRAVVTEMTILGVWSVADVDARRESLASVA